MYCLLRRSSVSPDVFELDITRLAYRILDPSCGAACTLLLLSQEGAPLKLPRNVPAERRSEEQDGQNSPTKGSLITHCNE